MVADKTTGAENIFSMLCIFQLNQSVLPPLNLTNYMTIFNAGTNMGSGSGVKGTKILTNIGYKLIDDLSEEDKLINKDGKIINIVKIYNFNVIPS